MPQRYMMDQFLRIFFSFIFLGFSFVLEAKSSYGNLMIKSVNRVHDGDTFIANIEGVHPLIGSDISIRIKGIDTPEITDHRQDIKDLALRAKEYVNQRLRHAATVELKDVQRDKYFRILADVLVDGNNIAQELVQLGFAKPYDGKAKPTW